MTWELVEHSWEEIGLYAETPTGKERICVFEISHEVTEENQDDLYAEMKRYAQVAAASQELFAALIETVAVLTEPGVMDVDEWKAWQKRTVANALDALRKAKGEQT